MEKKKREVNNLFNILNYIHVDKQHTANVTFFEYSLKYTQIIFDVEPVFGAIFLFLYIFIVVFCFMKVFTVIILDAFTSLRKDGIDDSGNEKLLASSIITVNTFIKQKTTINMYRNKNIAPKTGSTSMNM
jgi:hypothetical protein